MGYFQVRYDSRVVIYKCKMFIRLATELFCVIATHYFQLGKVEPPEETGMWGLGEWDQTEMENPWRFAKNKKMAPFDEKVPMA